MPVREREDYYYHHHRRRMRWSSPGKLSRFLSEYYPIRNNFSMVHIEKMTLGISRFKRDFATIFLYLRRITLSALVYLHSPHLDLRIDSNEIFFALWIFEINDLEVNDDRLNCREKIICWSVFHVEWMWVIRERATTNENLLDCSQSIIRECKWHEKRAPCVAWQQESVMWYNHRAYV